MIQLLFKALTAILLLFAFQFARGQNADSLRNVVQNRKAGDATRVDLLASLAMSYRAISPDSILYYADEGIALADKIDYPRGRARCLVAKTLGFLITGRYDSAVAASSAALTIFESVRDSAGMGDSYYFLGAATYSLSKFEEAIAYYKKTVGVSNRPGNEDRIGDALDNIGISYSTIGNYTESLKYYLEGLKIRERAGHKNDIATSLGNIGRVYASLGNRKKAYEYINKSLAAQVGARPEVLMLNYENAGNVYLTTRDTVAALNAFQAAMENARAAKTPSEYSRIMVNTAEVFMAMKRYDEAEKYYKESISLGEEVPNMPAVEAMIHRGLGRVYRSRGQYKKAIAELTEAIAMFNADGMVDHANETKKDLAIAYARSGAYKDGFETLLDSYAGRDSLVNEETERKSQQLQYEYDLWKKEAEIKLLEKDKAIAQSKAEKQNAVLAGLAAVVLLSLGLAVYMNRSRQRAKRAERKIAEQAAALAVINNYKDKIFSVISHDMRSPIGALDTSLAMLDENVISPGEFAELKSMLHRQLASVTVSLDNLLKWAATNIRGQRPLQKEPIELAPLVTQNIALMQFMADEKNIRIDNKIKTASTVIGDRGDVDVIIRNFISNALKFTPTGGSVQIYTENRDGKLQLTVKDTGIGMDAERLAKLFSLDHQFSTSGTAGEQGMGIGLLMSWEFAKANGGTIHAESSPGGGSSFILELPAA